MRGSDVISLVDLPCRLGGYSMMDRWTDDARMENNVALAHPYHEGVM